MAQHRWKADTDADVNRCSQCGLLRKFNSMDFSLDNGSTWQQLKKVPKCSNERKRIYEVSVTGTVTYSVYLEASTKKAAEKWMKKQLPNWIAAPGLRRYIEPVDLEFGYEEVRLVKDMWVLSGMTIIPILKDGETDHTECEKRDIG